MCWGLWAKLTEISCELKSWGKGQDEAAKGFRRSQVDSFVCLFFISVSWLLFKRLFHFTSQWLSIPCYDVSFAAPAQRKRRKLFCLLLIPIFLASQKKLSFLCFWEINFSETHTELSRSAARTKLIRLMYILALINWITCKLNDGKRVMARVSERERGKAATAAGIKNNSIIKPRRLEREKSEVYNYQTTLGNWKMKSSKRNFSRARSPW